MPIKGLTDQPARFIEIGQLRKGAKKTNPKKPGKDLTYFRATFNEGEEEAARMFQMEYGDEPKEINIVLPFDDVDENFEGWQEAYLAGGLLHRCNGEEVQRAIDPETGEVIVENGKHVATGEVVKCDGQPVAHWTDEDGKKHPVYCEPHGRFRVIIPELRRLAYVTVLTTSTWDIANVPKQLRAIKKMNNERLLGVPLVLKRRPSEISTPSGPKGKRARRKSWLLGVEPDRRWVEAQLEAMRAAALPNGDMPMLAEPEQVVEGETVGVSWDGQYPITMVELKQWASDEPYNFSNGDIRAAIAKRLADEFGDDPPTPEAFKKEVGEEEAAAYFWEAITAAWDGNPEEEFPF